jgi:hypothetical protein
MKLPNHTQALVAESKITDYLLSLTHSRGQSKARFFLRSRLFPIRVAGSGRCLAAARRHARGGAG